MVSKKFLAAIIQQPPCVSTADREISVSALRQTGKLDGLPHGPEICLRGGGSQGKHKCELISPINMMNEECQAFFLQCQVSLCGIVHSIVFWGGGGEIEREREEDWGLVVDIPSGHRAKAAVLLHRSRQHLHGEGSLICRTGLSLGLSHQNRTRTENPAELKHFHHT